MKTASIALVVALTLLAQSAMARGGGHGGGHSGGHASGHSSGGTHSVRGHTTKKGTYVKPHRQTNPDGSKRNNWSSKPNVNPDTGKAGTVDPNKP